MYSVLGRQDFPDFKFMTNYFLYYYTLSLSGTMIISMNKAAPHINSTVLPGNITQLSLKAPDTQKLARENFPTERVIVDTIMP